MNNTQKKIYNPLWKRLPREFVRDLPKYLVIFAFLTIMIGFISGEVVGGDSMLAAYNESFEKYKVEDGHFELKETASDKLLRQIQGEHIRLSECFRKDLPAGIPDDQKKWTIRVYEKRKKRNLECLMQGAFPKKRDEVALDRMFADNNGLKVGDPVVLSGKKFRISGLVALSDYSTLFKNNTDIMFDSLEFGVGIVSEKGWKRLPKEKTAFVYAYSYLFPPATKEREAEVADDLRQALWTKAAMDGNEIKDFVPRYLNQAIQFTADDFGSDQVMSVLLLYILIAVIAFIFAITTSNTIEREAPVIGTLRATGYTRMELLGHYMAMPVTVTLLAAILGNVLGYTVFKDMVAALYYNSYSLPTFVVRWNARAFLMTTFVPLILMFTINAWIISSRLKLSPLRFLRRDLSRSRKGKRQAMDWQKLGFFGRFRLRIIISNLPGYGVLVFGLVLVNLLLIFGMGFPSALRSYQSHIGEYMLARYQYILKNPDGTKDKKAEKFLLQGLETASGVRIGEDVSVYGFDKTSKNLEDYIDVREIPQNDEAAVLASSAYQTKFQLHEGDRILLKAKYAHTYYSFVVTGFVDYPGSICVFMDIGAARRVFGLAEDAYTGYLSDRELSDIKDKNIASVVTRDDVTAVSRQLEHSMGSFMDIFDVFCVILAVLLIFLLTKQIIEQSEGAISLTKVLGYYHTEIASLYLVATSLVVVFGSLVGIGLGKCVIDLVWRAFMVNYNGWIDFRMEPVTYLRIFGLDLLAYAVVAGVDWIRIRLVSMEQALKVAE